MPIQYEPRALEEMFNVIVYNNDLIEAPKDNIDAQTTQWLGYGRSMRVWEIFWGENRSAASRIPPISDALDDVVYEAISCIR